MRTALLSALAVCLFLAAASAGPVEDIASPSQETRDAAAKSLRENARPTPRKQWEAVIDAIKPGDTKAEIGKRLDPYKVTEEEMGAAGRESYQMRYVLDGYWILICKFKEDGQKLIERTLTPQMRHVSVNPPADFTGIWTLYYVNGQRCTETHYADGHRSGTYTTYYDDGTICGVQNYNDQGVIHGDQLAFFPSGKIRIRGRWQAGQQVGTWTYYNEDGTVLTIDEHLPKKK
jgi:hypothetical protein